MAWWPWLECAAIAAVYVLPMHRKRAAPRDDPGTIYRRTASVCAACCVAWLPMWRSLHAHTQVRRCANLPTVGLPACVTGMHLIELLMAPFCMMLAANVWSAMLSNSRCHIPRQHRIHRIHRAHKLSRCAGCWEGMAAAASGAGPQNGGVAAGNVCAGGTDGSAVPGAAGAAGGGHPGAAAAPRPAPGRGAHHVPLYHTSCPVI